MIKEVIVVEGKDDEAAVKNAVEAEIIITHGYGISQKTYKRIEEAYNRCGIIIFTDPDYAGENIRKKLSARFPLAKHAFISKEAGTKDDDIGVENASSAAIQKALSGARAESVQKNPVFSMSDMVNGGLCGGEEAALRRNRLGEILGIGYGNTKTFLRRLNNYGITVEEFKAAFNSLD
ncbi:MAG: ribonuclease M5 [Bacillota bacterium]|nr:ribonuclease M5 [Bacillota bacterium]